MPEVIMPKMGDAMEEGTLLSWKKQDGERVTVGEIIAEIETDKSNVEVPAEDAGVLHTQARPGDVVPVGHVIATIGDAPAAPAPRPAPAPRQEKAPPKPVPAAPAPPARTANGQERLKASPLARRVAREQGIDIARLSGTGPQGRIVEADVQAFARQGGAGQPVAPSPLSAPSTAVQPGLPSAKPTAEAPQQRAAVTPAPATSPIPLSAMRKVIARRMTESKTTIPHFYITSEIDMAEALALREKLNAYDDALPKISLNDMVVKASALALARVPAANAAYAHDSVIPGAGIHVGIAVALDDGLIVPVVRDADTLPLRRLSQVSKDLIKKAREKKLLPQEYSDGTFTVSNLGSFDVENFIAIIDPSQGAILAVSSIVRKPVVLDGDVIAVRPRMNVTFSGDHRVMDGATGARFLQELKRVLQNPLALLES